MPTSRLAHDKPTPATPDAAWPCPDAEVAEVPKGFGVLSHEVDLADLESWVAGTSHRLGAIWIYVLQSSNNADIEVVGDNFLDNTYNAMMAVSDFPGKDLYDITNVHFRDIEVEGAGTDVFDARSAGNATFQNVDVRNIGW